MKALRRGFTLIELLVVIGLIAVLAGVLGLALGRGNSGTALQTAQSTMSAMVAGARSQAAVALRDAAVAININPDSDGFLRELIIVTTTDNTNWLATGTESTLPAGVYFVPFAGSFPTARLDYSTSPAWTATNRSSAFAGPAAFKPKATNGTTDLNNNDFRLITRFTPRGTTGSGTLNRIVFSVGQRTSGTALLFDNPSALRGMTISTYGIATLRNDAESF